MFLQLSAVGRRMFVHSLEITVWSRCLFVSITFRLEILIPQCVKRSCIAYVITSWCLFTLIIHVAVIMLSWILAVWRLSVVCEGIHVLLLSWCIWWLDVTCLLAWLVARNLVFLWIFTHTRGLFVVPLLLLHRPLICEMLLLWTGQCKLVNFHLVSGLGSTARRSNHPAE